ncbi:Serum opacity factor [Streptococcus pyogenes]|uniref:serum opacification factor n=1 Tax=Streptococcus pyogenes TaxID=1314 RepID=UPI000DA270C5|nr:serum opacification factor [Streptococcus pyogenes]SQG41534.1 Serum opacity factor [Streptococcus pyogenes]HEP1344083.1 fibronectin binding protein [Streptococcus pyogenes]
MTNCKYKLRKLSVGLVSVGTMLIAPTVLGQEVSAGASSSTETSAASASAGTSTSETAASGTGSEAAVVSSEGSQSSESAQASPQPQPQAQTVTATTSTSSTSSSSDGKSTKSATSSTSSAFSTSSSEDKAPKAASTKSSSTTVASPSNGSNQGASTETEPQMMEVEQYKVDKEETELKVKDGSKLNSSSDKKLIRNRDGEQRDIFDIKREVKTNSDGTIDVTVTVTPKEIDKGADVMALLDVSKKMSEDDFNNAKDKIKKLVTTLTSKSTDSQPNHNARNSVRLMTFYRKVNDPIELTAENVDAKLKEVWEQAKKDWDWGVDLQGAIHKAREIFNKEKEKNSGKRQHIVLFSQGEATFSYDINDKDKNKNNTVKKNRITGKVTTSNPLFPGLPIFNHTNQKAEIIDDVDKLLNVFEKLGIRLPSGLRTGLQTLSLGNGLIGSFVGGGLTEYLTLKEYDSEQLNSEQFDYTKRVGEGYYHHSYSRRTHEDKMPLEEAIRAALESSLPKLSDDWFFGILKSSDIKAKVGKARLDVIMQVLNSIFYKREYHYYNHNLSAIAEAKMAQKEGITFYSVDVTDSDKASKRVKRQVGKGQSEKKKEDAEKDRNKKFDDYLKKMSEGGNAFFNDVDKADKFKDTLTELTIKDEFEDKVTVETNSEGKKNYKTNLNENTLVNHTPSKAAKWFSSATKESLTWTISKDQLKKAFEDGTSLTLTYKLKVENDKLKKALDDNREKKRKKRDTSTENENSVTEKIISNTITYKINDQNGQTGKKLDDVNLTYSKFKVPVPQIDGHVIEPQAPTLPKLPPVTERGPVLDYTEESIYRLPLEHGSNAPDTQVTIEEDTVPQRPDILVGGQSGPVDITEDTQPGMSGSNDATVVEEDTAPKRPDVLVGGQSDPIDIIEDTQPSVSGSNDATVVEEDTVPQRPDILVGGQSDPIDITEDTQPGMSGSNDATVIEEDTKPKRFFHFDNEPQAPEKPKEQPSLSLPQAPVYKAAHHLPASGDKREASFTIVALTIIGAAGLLSKKRRDTEEN